MKKQQAEKAAPGSVARGVLDPLTGKLMPPRTYHSPLPWQIAFGWPAMFEDASSRLVGRCNSVADAALIVRAVNAHDALMAACEGVCESYRTYDMAGAVKKCRAALALARGEPVAR